MGSAGSPSKKAPAKRGAAAKPNRPKPKSSKAKGATKSSKIDAALSVAESSVVRQHLRIATNLPACIVDNGGWTVKFGLVPPLELAGSAQSDSMKLMDVAGENNGGVNSSSNNNSNNDAVPDENAKDNVRMSSMYNATARPPHQLTVLVGDEITSRMKNLGQLSWNYPMERGMVCDGETQLRVWARVLEILGVVPVPVMAMMGAGGRMAGGGGGGFLATIAVARRGNIDPMAGKQQQQMKYLSNNCAFVLLVPPFVPSVISEGVDCILFRELGMARVSRMLGACMGAVRYLSFCQSVPDSSSGGWINDKTECCCVVDSGYSFTHAVPTYRGEALVKAIRRLDVGGKVLTNLLKEDVTYRQWNMMDEYHIVNDAKEQLCFVIEQFDIEMKQARATRKGLRWFDREYLLPDFVNTFRGSVRLPQPLQIKKEMKEMESFKKEIDRLNDQKEQRELAEEAKDLSNMLLEVSDGLEDKSTESKSENQREQKKCKRWKANKEKKQKEHNTNKEGNEDQDVDDSGDESDEETDKQRLQRLKAMREAERKRREEESLERQALAMSVERFAIPEVLFRPSDIGLDCGGIAEAIAESIEACDPNFRAAMYHNVLLVGGNAKIPGFRARVESELRKLAPTNYKVRIYLPEDPVSYVFEGAKQFSEQPGFQERFSVDRLSWEAMKKAGVSQQEIWGKMMYNSTERQNSNHKCTISPGRVPVY